MNMPSGPAANTDGVPPGTCPGVSQSPGGAVDAVRHASEGLTQRPSRLPLLGRVTHLIPGQEIVCERNLDLREDLFLKHHCFVPVTEDDDPANCLPTVPLTASVEWMAEVAACLAPGLGLVAVEDVQASSWLWLTDAEPLPVRVEAWRMDHASDPACRIGARIYCRDRVCVTGQCLFDSAYRRTSNLIFRAGTQDLPAEFTPERFYGERFAFHGPLMRCVSVAGPRTEFGMTGELIVLPRQELFASQSDPEFLADPVIMDGVAQVMGLWLLERGWLTLPVGLKRLELYRPPVAPGTRIPVRVEMVDRDPLTRQVTTNLEVQDGAGSVWMRMEGWRVWEYPISKRLYAYQRQSEVNTVGQELTFPDWPGAMVCLWGDTTDLKGSEPVWVGRVVFHPEESEPAPPSIKDEVQQLRLLGRMLLKDAARVWCSRRNGEAMPAPRRLLVRHDERGKPHVEWPGREICLPEVSVAHSGRTAIAVACEWPVGVDVEEVPCAASKLVEVFAGPDERRLLAPLMEQHPAEEWATRLWCAKEAASKAFGTGLEGHPQAWEALDVNSTGSLRLRHQPDGTCFEVRTRRWAQSVVACAWIRRCDEG